MIGSWSADVLTDQHPDIDINIYEIKTFIPAWDEYGNSIINSVVSTLLIVNQIQSNLLCKQWLTDNEIIITRYDRHMIVK